MYLVLIRRALHRRDCRGCSRRKSSKSARLTDEAEEGTIKGGEEKRGGRVADGGWGDEGNSYPVPAVAPTPTPKFAFAR